MFEKFFFLKEKTPMRNKIPPSGGWGCIPSYNNPPLPPEKVNKMIPIKEVLENYLADLIKEQQRIKEFIGFLLVDKVNYNNIYLQIKALKEMQEVIDYLVKEIENEN